jgi:hypothetical protein
VFLTSINLLIVLTGAIEKLPSAVDFSDLDELADEERKGLSLDNRK